MIAYLGTGLLGTGFVKALLAKGEKVRVWNRSADKAKLLEAAGAVAYENAAEAVRGISRIHLTLSDDASVDSVLEQAAPGITPGSYILDHTTTSVEGAIRRTAYWAQKGIYYVHTPVFMGPANALESSGFMLISGDQDIAKRVSPWLEPMTGKLLNFGEQTGKAAGIKLIGNLFLLTLTAGMSDMLSLAKSMDMNGADIQTLFEAFNAGASAPARLKRILSADWDNPSWELQMARKDARLMMAEAHKAHRSLVLVPVIAKEMDRFLEKGFAHKDWSIIASENL